jgi:hypothetical protein
MTALLLAASLVQDGGPLDWARALDEADLSWSWGPLDFELGGELDLELLFYEDEAPGTQVEDAPLRSDHYKRPGQADSPEGGGRLKLTLDGGIGERVAWFLEGRIDHGAPFEEGEAVGARVEQAWGRAGVVDGLNVTLGKFAAPVGNWIPRHAPKDNPLTTAPLPYDQVTTFMQLSDTTAAVLNRRDRPDVKDWRVPIYRELYGVGGMASGQAGPVAWAVAVMNIAPADWVFDWNAHAGDFSSPNLYARAAWAVGPTLTLGGSWSRGPHSRDDADGVPSGREAGDFPQTLAGVDVQWSSGDWDVFAELYWSRIEAPLVEDLDLWAGYVEAKRTILPGLFGAARLGRMQFGEIEDAAGESRRWDRTSTRAELGAGYFFTRNMLLKATGQLNFQSGGREPDDDLLMVQWVLTF